MSDETTPIKNNGDDVFAVSNKVQSEPSERTESDRKNELRTRILNLPLWHSDRGEAFATIKGSQHVPVRSVVFKDFVYALAWSQWRYSPSALFCDQLITQAQSKAFFEGSKHRIDVRIAGDLKKLYIDLGNDKAEVVEVTADGWRIITDPPVRFIRPSTLGALPHPEIGGSISELSELVNYDTEADFTLMVGWLLGCLMPSGSRPVLCTSGAQGSAKTTVNKILRTVVDPSRNALRPPFKDTRDLAAAAANSWVLAFDNVSKLTELMSDALCRLATGGTFSGRKLYTDFDEAGFEACRPVVLNGIPDLATQPDLADRSIIIRLPTIASENRKTEAELWERFDKAHPRIFGALLDAVSGALARINNLELSSYPRMADWMRFITAAETELGFSEGTFADCFEDSRKVADAVILGDEPVAELLDTFIKDRGTWTGTMSQLLIDLKNSMNVETMSAFGPNGSIPRSPKGLGVVLARLEEPLKRLDIVIERHRTSESRRITIRRI